MGKDVGWKRFFSDNVRYADLINGFGCNGDQIVKKEDLQDMDVQTGIQKPENFVVTQKNEKEPFLKERDMVRKVAFGINFAIIGIEQQEEIDYRIPLRQMSYEAGEYENQAATIRKEVRNNSKGLDTGEYLYGFLKESRLHPVITFVVYTGEKEWDGPLCLADIIDFQNIPVSLRKMVNNYYINLLEIHKWDNFEIFHSDVRYVFAFIRYSREPERLKELVMRESYYKEMDEDAFDVVVKYTKAKELIQVKDYHRVGGRIDMCEALTTLIEEGKAEGKAEGKIEGIEFGRQEGERKFALLTEYLLGQNRTDNLLKAINDIDYRKTLYKELGIDE